MKTLSICSFLTVVALTSGCSTSSQSPDVAPTIRTSLDQANLKNVSVSDDRDKGVVTLAGSVQADADKSQAESIAKSLSGGQVVADQIAVLPPGAAGDAKKIDADLDKGIENNLDAALVAQKLNGKVKYSVKNSVVTLTGNVNSGADRKLAQQVATTVPNVRQVVNELQVKGQKATSSN